MVVRTVQPGSSLPSTEIHVATNTSGSKTKVARYAPPSPRLSYARQLTPVSQRHSPGRPRLSVAVPSSKSNVKDERRDDLTSHDEGETVCDYDTNATMLYELLESSSWERAGARCRSNPEEVRTWIIRKDKTLSVRWKLLPLHAAIIFQSPNFLVSALLDQYPAAASKKDDQGMLPLHLAFRHKQEDEDLLELLLVRYPKAVMIKDRRDRVPLEHGRESKFSAKVMRLYADAVTAASRLVGGKVNGVPTTPTTTVSASSMTAGARALLIKEHRDEIAAMKTKYESQLLKVKSISGEQMHHVEEKARIQVEQLRADFDAQIRDMKDAHERRLASMRQSHQSNLTHVEQAAEDEKREMIERHTKEVNTLRNLVDDKVNEDRKVTYMLEKEVAQLQIALQDHRTESERAEKRVAALNEENARLHDVLKHVQSQQVSLNDMLTQQNDELQANRSIRNQLIQTLQRQDESDRNGRAILEVADQIRRKVTTTLIDLQQVNTTSSRPHSPLQSSPKNRPARESRIERERNDLRNENIGMNRVEKARTKDSFISNRHNAIDVMPPGNPSAQYEEVKLSGDEISAMTDCSEY